MPGPPSPVGAGPAAGPEQQLGVSLVTAGPVSPGEWGAGHGPGSPVRGQRDQELLHRRRPPRPAQTTPPITNTTNSTQRKLKLSSVTGWLLTTDPPGADIYPLFQTTAATVRGCLVCLAGGSAAWQPALEPEPVQSQVIIQNST